MFKKVIIIIQITIFQFYFFSANAEITTLIDSVPIVSYSTPSHIIDDSTHQMLLFSRDINGDGYLTVFDFCSNSVTKKLILKKNFFKKGAKYYFKLYDKDNIIFIENIWHSGARDSDIDSSIFVYSLKTGQKTFLLTKALGKAEYSFFQAATLTGNEIIVLKHASKLKNSSIFLIKKNANNSFTFDEFGENGVFPLFEESDADDEFGDESPLFAENFAFLETFNFHTGMNKGDLIKIYSAYRKKDQEMLSDEESIFVKYNGAIKNLIYDLDRKKLKLVDLDAKNKKDLFSFKQYGNKLKPSMKALVTKNGILLIVGMTNSEIVLVKTDYRKSLLVKANFSSKCPFTSSIVPVYLYKNKCYLYYSELSGLSDTLGGLFSFNLFPIDLSSKK